MFAVVLWAGFFIGLACAWSRRWYVVLAGGIVLSIASFAAAIGYLGGIVVFVLLARPRRRKAA
jgi:membrane associated rhomboid family serine protease